MVKKMFFPLMLFVVAITSYLDAQTSDSIEAQQIDEIKITAYRIKSDLGKIPQQIKIISAGAISGIPSRGFDELLKKSVAVDIIQYPGFSSVIGMRGFAPSGFGKANTLIMIDGIPLGTSNLSTIDLENIEQIEILKGPYSAFFGSDAMAGVINISTRQSKEKLTGNASISYGSYKTHKIELNLGGKIGTRFNFDLFANARVQNENYKTGNNNLLNLTDDEKTVMEEKSYGKEYLNSKYKQYNIGSRLGFQINKNWQIRMDQSYWLAKDIQNNGNLWGSYSGQLQDIGRWSQSLSIEGKAGNHQLRLSPHFSSESSVFYSDLSENGYKNQDNTLKTYGFILQDAIQIGNHSLIIGTDNLSRSFKSKLWSGRDTLTSPYQPDYLNMSTGVYFQFNMHFLDNNLNASIGGRYDYILFKLFETELIESSNASENYHVFNPNFGLQYKLLNGFKAHTAAGTAFVAPDAFKVAGNYTTLFGTYKGNPDLKPEKSVTYDIGLAYNNKKAGLSADITYFSTYYKNIIGYDYSNMEYTSYKNENEAHMDGIEVEFEYDFGALVNYKYSIKSYASYTHMLNSKVDVAGNKLDMKYVRKGKASFGLGFESRNGLNARINVRYIGQRYEDNWLYNIDWNTWERIPFVNANGQEIRPSLINQDIIEFPDHLVVDLSVSYFIKKKFGLGISVDNLFDENYCEKDAYYMPGRNFMGYITYKF